MNRPINFRVWDKQLKKMRNITMLATTNDEFGIDYQAQYYYNGEYTRRANIELMQYTGLKDKNGVEIYEGDIVKIYHKETENTPDEYRNVEAFRFELEDVRHTFKMSGMGDNDYEKVFREVIGNIYENPNLLK